MSGASRRDMSDFSPVGGYNALRWRGGRARGRRAAGVERAVGAEKGDSVSDERADAILAALGERGETLAVAESLTGGLLAAAFVEVPGASRVFRGGIVAYATELKAKLLAVPPPLLSSHGPVDPAVAAAMAAGARERCGADWAA